MKRRMTTVGWLARSGGVALIAVGVAVFLLGLLVADGQPIALMLAGGQSMLMGSVLYCYQQLLARSTQNEEALKFQFDIGYEAGYQDRERLARPVLVDLHTGKTAVR